MRRRWSQRFGGEPLTVLFETASDSRPGDDRRMANVTLDDFIGRNRDEIIRRCSAKMATRSGPRRTEVEIDQRVPLFLDQLVKEMRDGPSQTHEISKGAIQHGPELLLQGFTISKVVHNYGDVCQSITDLAVDLSAPISTEDFRTLNRCLDDAIAGAVTEYAREQAVPREGELHQLQNLTNSALIAFEVLQTAKVGVAGSTGAMVHRNLIAIRAALVSRLRAEITPPLNDDEHALQR
jgi:hypothetical protein